MAKSGLYALAALDGAALDPGDVAVLELDAAAPHQHHLPGFAVKAVDREEAGRAVSFAERADGLTMLLGHLDEPDALADRLGLDRGTPFAALAGAALSRFGADAPFHLIGEWSLLDWHAPSRTLTLLMSEATRDPLFFAFDGKRLAVSAEINRLTRLPWVGRDFDPGGLLFYWSTARMRRYMTDETSFRNVRRVAPGSRDSFRLDARGTLRLPPPPPIEPWRGDFGEALGALEALLRRIVGQHLSRHGPAASLLSGGLDSSLIAWLGSVTRRPDQPLSFLSSAAPEGSDIFDERNFSGAVADHLGLPIRFLTPAPDVSLYVPADRLFAHTELPVASPRHHVYNLLYEAAFDAGAEVLLDGAYGELTITNPVALKLPHADVRRYVREFRRWRRMRAMRLAAPEFPFHLRLSRAAEDAFPAILPYDWQAPLEESPKLETHRQWGIRAAAVKNAMTPSSAPEARLRHVMPFRDRRLLNLFGAMPAGYLEQGGLNRAPARMMLKDRLPNSIRLRPTGGPFSPDFLIRAERQALETIHIIPEFRAAGAGDWIDLDWMEQELRQIAVPGSADYRRVHRIQSTTMAASYLLWLSRQ